MKNELMVQCGDRALSLTECSHKAKAPCLSKIRMDCGLRFVFWGKHQDPVLPTNGHPVARLRLLNLDLHAQDYVPDLGPAFLADEVASVRLTLAQTDLDFILNPDNAYSNVEWPGTFVYESSAGIDTVSNVGIRLRGNTSRNAAKKSFKVSFNTFTAGGKWNGLEKMNLNGNHNDPSMMRARMVWEYMRAQGYIAPRISHIRLYINDEYRGLYINVEHVDEEFLKKRFKHAHGNLWKCTYPADLADLGDDPESYKFTPSWNDQQRAYELKTNETADDYSAIRDLCHTVGTASDGDFQCALESVFDVDGLAFGRGGNSRRTLGQLHRQPKQLLPVSATHRRPAHDDQLRRRQHVGDRMGWQLGEPERLRLGPMGNQTAVRPNDASGAIPHPLGWYIRDLIDNGSFTAAAWLQQGNTLKTLCTSAALEDVYRTYDYGFDDDAFLNCLTSGWGNHVTQGIASYVNTRAPLRTAKRRMPSSLEMSKAGSTPLWWTTPCVSRLKRRASPSRCNCTSARMADRLKRI